MFIKILLVASLSYITNSTIHYVIPENYQFAIENNCSHPLQQYLDNSRKYFISNVQLHFLQGEHHLNTDLVLKDISNFTITGTNFTITCTAPAGMITVNITDLKLENITFVKCGKNQSVYFNSTYFSSVYINDPESLNKIGFNASIIIYHCSSVAASNINITVNAGTIGLLVVNARGISTLSHVSIQVISLCLTFQSQITGTLVYYSGCIKMYNHEGKTNVVAIDHFHYELNKFCPNNLQYAITFLLFESEYYSVKITVEKTVFKNFTHSSVLFFYQEMLTLPSAENRSYKIIIRNCTISNNIGRNNFRMFHIIYKSVRTASILYNSKIFYSKLFFTNCIFESNNQMEVMIFVMLVSSRKLSAIIYIDKVKFQNNRDVNFLKVKGRTEIVWLLKIFIFLHCTSISLNQQQNSDSLISLSNSIVSFSISVFFTNNSFYDNLIKLHLSTAVFKGYIELTDNCVRHILHASSSSYFCIREHTILNISNNVVYTVVKQMKTYNDNAQPICAIQFTGLEGDLDDGTYMKALSYKILMINNELMTSKNLLSKEMSLDNCTWIASTSFKMATANDVFNKVLTENYTVVNSTRARIIPLSVCLCSSIDNYSNCYSPNLGSIFPGQTLTIQLMVSKQYFNKGDPSTTLVVANTPDDECSVLNSHQLLQTHFNHGCNNYSYTIWPSNDHMTECKLFLGLKDMPEMFYVQIKSCPKGFVLINDRKACYCDPLLDNNIVSITSCNLDDETILCPANSWISADTVNKSHTYLISSHCPFYYCLPHPLYLDLSYPDSQCQFNRSGRLCGHCQEGHSTVIGSLQCKKCSNIYLLIVIPIVIAGIMLVIILFISQLTVTSGTINIFIFYANIISINYPMFCSNGHSIDCTLLSLINLDLGIETCFYNGMTDFAKMWLQLAFPLYLVLIAVVLIIGSRHSITIQRLTARRAIQVLATLFLLAYTKTLLTVCQVLFFFSQVTHIPSKKTTVVWSVDSSVSLSEIKFWCLFVVCIVLFLILSLFNIILLFPRTLSRIRFINTFKPLLDAYFGPYKDGCSFWTGLLLLVRAVFLALSAVGKDYAYIGCIALLGALLCIQGIMHPLKNKFNNIKECLVLFNLVILYVTVIVLKDDDEIGKIVMTKFLINIVLASFVVSVVVHCIMFKCSDAIKRRYYNIIRKLKSNFKKWSCTSDQTQSLGMKTFSSEIPDVTYCYQELQEPLVGIDD